jgi:hypothetical protein
MSSQCFRKLCPLRFGESHSLSVPGKRSLQLRKGASSGFDGDVTGATLCMVDVHDGRFDLTYHFGGWRRICAGNRQKKACAEQRHDSSTGCRLQMANHLGLGPSEFSRHRSNPSIVRTQNGPYASPGAGVCTLFASM